MPTSLWERRCTTTPTPRIRIADTPTYLGGSGGLATTSFWDETSPGGFPNPGHCGFSVCTAGDLNGDGLADIVMGFPTHSNGQFSEGGFGVFQSTKAFLGGLPFVESNEANAQMGYVVMGAGDVNGDGFGDLMVSAPYHANGPGGRGPGVPRTSAAPIA